MKTSGALSRRMNQKKPISTDQRILTPFLRCPLFFVRAGQLRWEIGKAKLQAIYRKFNGSPVLVWEGEDGSNMPGRLYSSGSSYLPIYFDYFEKTDALRELGRGH